MCVVLSCSTLCVRVSWNKTAFLLTSQYFETKMAVEGHIELFALQLTTSDIYPHGYG